MVVPEFRWPTTPATLASHSFWAAAVPCFGSAASSSAWISNLTVLPPILTPLGVQVLDGHADAVLVVLAVVRLGARQRRDVTDLDDLLLGGATPQAAAMAMAAVNFSLNCIEPPGWEKMVEIRLLFCSTGGDVIAISAPEP